MFSMVEDERKSLLVIEDEEDLLEVLSENLNLHGYDVIGVTTGQEALSKISNQKFDCILVDLNLGARNYDGKKIIKAIKTSPQCKINEATPVILCSGNIDAEAVTSLSDDIVAAVTKPIDIFALVDKLVKVTGG